MLAGTEVLGLVRDTNTHILDRIRNRRNGAGMTFPFTIKGEIKIEASGCDSGEAVLEKLAHSVKREGGTNIAINGDILEFAGLVGQLSMSPLVNIARASVIVGRDQSLVCLTYVMRPETWALGVGAITIAVGVVGWLFSIFPLGFPAGVGLATLIIWIAYVPIQRFRYESFLRRSIDLQGGRCL